MFINTFQYSVAFAATFYFDKNKNLGTKWFSVPNTLLQKCSYSEFFWPAFGLNKEGYFVSLHIQSKCGKILTRKTPNTDTFYVLGFHEGFPMC